MKATSPRPLSLAIAKAGPVSALLMRPPDARACFVFAHGAGAGMTHSFMEAVAGGLCERGVATLRYQFPYMEKGSKRPDSPTIAHATVRAAVAEAGRCCPGLPLIAGGKSFGGRMTSQAQAAAQGRLSRTSEGGANDADAWDGLPRFGTQTGNKPAATLAFVQTLAIRRSL
jgi:hypothetical protein